MAYDDVVFVVEADDFAQQALWERWHKKLSWQPSTRGEMIQIGLLSDRPVVITLFIHTLQGHKVLFYSATSQVVDHKMVEEWFDEHCCPKWDNGTRTARTDANNFHHVINHLDSLTHVTRGDQIRRRHENS
jgi:hypothetical protein